MAVDLSQATLVNINSKRVYYIDTTDPVIDVEYFCDSTPGTDLTNPSWRIVRIRTIRDGGAYIEGAAGPFTDFPEGNDKHTYPATNLAVVSSYTYK